MASQQLRDPRTWPALAPFVLVVDDEPDVRDYVRRVLVHHGFTPLEAASAKEAIALLERPSPGIAAVLTDCKMPDGGAAALLAWRDAHAPTLGVICMTGALDRPLAGVPVVYKPFAIRELLAAVRAVLPASAPEAASARG